MSRLAKAAVSGVIAAGVLAIPSAAFAATTECDAYSTTCVQGEKQFNTPPSTLPTQTSTLPFTGTDVLAMTVTSLVALGGGTALVVAGRRRRTVLA